MPLFKKKSISLLPLPTAVRTGSLDPTSEVFYLQATGEIFLDFESYSKRIAFYLQKIFTDDATGKTHIDYYTALNLERRDRENLNQRFPAILRGRVHRSVHCQSFSRLDSMIDLIYDRYKDRYFIGDYVTLEMNSYRFHGHVVKIALPAALAAKLPAQTDLGQQTPQLDQAYQNAIAALAHSHGVDLSIPADQLATLDPLDDYIYTVELTDNERYPPGTVVDATRQSIYRERSSFSKSILKRFYKDTISREGGLSGIWLAKPRIAREYGLPSASSFPVKSKVDSTQRTLSKRKKTKNDGYGEDEDEDEDGTPAHKKARQTANADDLETYAWKGHIDPKLTRAQAVARARGRATKVMEDLYIDLEAPLDGKKVKTESNGTLAMSKLSKPAVKHDIPLLKPLFNEFLHLWVTLNVFGWPLTLSNFTLDQFEQALRHDQIDPRSSLLAEIHGCLLNIITSEGHRVPNTTAAMASGVTPPFCTEEVLEGQEPLTTKEKERYVRLGLEYSRKWDRSKRLAVSTARIGWEKHLVGCLIQRGGIQSMPALPRIIKHMFSNYRKAEEEAFEQYIAGNAHPAAPEPDADDKSSEKDELQSETNGDIADDAAGLNTPPIQYLTLRFEDKVTILRYLVDLVMGSAKVKIYMENCEFALPELRKRKMDARKSSLRDQANLEDGEFNQPSTNGRSPSVGMRSSRANSVEVGSDVDELASTEDSPETARNGHIVSRQPDLREQAAMNKAIKNKSGRKSKTAVQYKEEPLENFATYNIDDNTEDLMDREIRRHTEVLRVKPLGKDRFFNRYWYFDGVGTMELINPDDGSVVYGTGRLWIQGPSSEDFAWAIELASEAQAAGLRERQLTEHGFSLEEDEWVYIDDSESLEQLLQSLHPRGTREANLKQGISELQRYIVAGFQKRREDLDTSTNDYMAYTNEFAIEAAAQVTR